MKNVLICNSRKFVAWVSLVFGLVFPVGAERAQSVASASADRPQLRFTQRAGWANDPNGLIWWNGDYHFFHQHCPFDIKSEPKYWNHAVSKDLVHWEELGDALAPDALGEMWSGSAVCDRRNTAGFGTNALVLVYTAWKKGGRQCLAHSADGRTFTKYAGNPVLKTIHGEDRDPRVFWHEPTRRWVMALYGKENDAGGVQHHVIWIFSSPDLKDWRKESTYFGGAVGKDRYLLECPLFEELKVEGEKSTAWVVAGADGDSYSVGSFDGHVFTPQAERIPWESPMGTYAAQTFNDDPAGRRIAISWLMLPQRDGATYRHSFSLPRTMTLRRTPAGLRLAQRPVRELELLRAGPAVQPESFQGELAEIVLQGELSPDAYVALDVRGMKVVLDAAKHTFSVGTQSCRWTPGDRLDMTLYVDRVSAEAFGNGGFFWTTFPDAFPDARRRDIRVLDCRGLGKPSFRVYPLKGISGTVE